MIDSVIVLVIGGNQYKLVTGCERKYLTSLCRIGYLTTQLMSHASSLGNKLSIVFGKDTLREI